VSESGPFRAAVLAGGLGTRLRPYTTILPKPLVPVGERPILELILAWLARSGVKRVDVCLGHLGALIQTYFSQAETLAEGLELGWVWEGDAQGTAGALRGIGPLDDTLLVVNGDILTDLDPGEMLAFHRRQGAALTIAARRTKVPTELGVIEHSEGRVSGYHEKPVLNYDASIGVYLYEPRALEAIPEGTVQFPELVLELLARGEHVSAFLTDAQWHDVGTPAQHDRASREVDRIIRESDP
jgi:NDP-sugar pyrophosphorylase family protein